MRLPRSLQARLGLSLGVVLTLLWIVSSTLTAVIVHGEMDKVFDSALQETAQRILPLAVTEIVAREESGVTQRLAALREHEEFFTYLVRDAEGHILLQSHAADPAVFPAYEEPGFYQNATHRLYNEAALQGTIQITAAEPLERRAAVARELQLGLGLPLLIVLPVALLAIVLVVRESLEPLRRFRASLEARHSRDLSPVSTDDMPTEIGPLASTFNTLLERLREAFEAERSFAANAAHELRTPLAGAIAQAQRLRSETSDAAAARRASDIEERLKRLTRRTERLMQLARAEGGRLQSDHASDLRIAVRIVIKDMQRGSEAPTIALNLPDAPVLSPLDPDAVGIVCHNLVQNAIGHGSANKRIDVTLTPDAELTVANDGPIVPPERLARLTERFQRDDPSTDGSGLGLYIVAAIAGRTGSLLTLSSPRPGNTDGFEARIRLPSERNAA